MSLTVRAVQLLERARTVPIEGAPGMPAGFESWRTDVWASSAVISLAEAVRRPRPSRLILLVLDGSGTPHIPSESELVEDFRGRLLNIKAAVQLARTARGGVEIA